MYEEASFRPASYSLHSMKSVHGNQSRRVGDEPTIPRKAFKRKRPTARDTSDLLFRKQKSCPRATRHRRGHDSTLAVSTSSYSQCAREHSADIPDGHMLLLPPPPSMSCWHSMPVRVDKNRRADKGEWHAMLAQCAPPSATTMKKQ